MSANGYNKQDLCSATNYTSTSPAKCTLTPELCVMKYVFGTEMTYVCIHCNVEHTFFA